MRNTLAIAQREIRAYFSSPLAYVVLGVFLALSGYIFWSALIYYSDACLRYGSNPLYRQQLNVNAMVIRPIFGNMGFLLLMMIPLLSMRLLAEERRTGTSELLFTCPITSAQVVLGKFLGATGLLFLMLSGTLVHPFLLMATDARPDMRSAFVGYLGILLMGMAFLGVGLLISSLTENQIVAAVGTFGVLLILWVISFVSESITVPLGTVLDRLTVGIWTGIGWGLGGPSLGKLLSSISLVEHFEDFRKGILDTRHIIFYATFIFLSLFLTQRVVESQKWR
ncbi:MAG: ABC transporter permease [Acidobacteria bacterium]|nr:ABC transporter permease [Acidobacteriota bacterium]